MAALFVHDHTADDRSLLVRDEVFGIQDLSGKIFLRFSWHGFYLCMM